MPRPIRMPGAVLGCSLFVILAAVGCMPAERAPRAPHAEGPADPELEANARRVRVLPNANVGCVPEVLGLVDVHEGAATQEQALEELRIEAAKLGAEAVIGVEFEHADGKAATHLSGMAVRCHDLLRGRAYDVISVIEVPGDMGKEDAAFDALRARGRELHADVLIATTFVHGEGGGKTLLRATAVRIRDNRPAAAP